MTPTHFLAINYTILVGGQQLQGNMIYPSSLDTVTGDLAAFSTTYPLAEVAFYTLSSVPDPAVMHAPQYPLNRK